MKRLLAILLVAGVLLPAGLALRAQEDSRGGQLEDLLESLREALAREQGRAPAQPVTFVLRMYDLRSLTTPIPDYPGEDIDLTPSGGFGFGFGSDEEQEAMPFFEIDGIVDFIRANVAPTSWDELRSVSVEAHGGILMVRHTAGVQARVARLLEDLKGKAAAQITVDVKLVRTRDAVLRGILLGGESPCVLRGPAKERLAKAVFEGRAEVVRQGSISCTNTQRVALRDLGRVSYVQDYDVEIAQGSCIPDPIVGQFSEGLIFEVRPILAGHDDVVVLDMRADFSHQVGPLAALDTPAGAIETPVIDLLKVRTALAAPLGCPVVVGGALSDGDDTAVLLVVTATATRPGEK